MTDERYGKIKRRFWTDDKVMQWDPDVRLLALYLMTSPHGNMLGCYFLPIEYLVSDLQMTKRKIQKGLKILENFDFLKRDETLNLILITNFLGHNSIENPNQVTSCIKLLETSNILKSPLAYDLYEKLKQQTQKYMEPLLQLFRNSLPNSLGNPFETLSKPIGKPESILAESILAESILINNNNNNAREGVCSCPPADSLQSEQIKTTNLTPVNDHIVDANKMMPISENAFTVFENNIGLLSSHISERIGAAVDDTSDECVCEAIKRAVKHGAYNWAYAESIVKSWAKRGIKTLGQVEALDVERANSKTQGKPKNRGDSQLIQAGETGGWDVLMNGR